MHKIKKKLLINKYNVLCTRIIYNRVNTILLYQYYELMRDLSI